MSETKLDCTIHTQKNASLIKASASLRGTHMPIYRRTPSVHGPDLIKEPDSLIIGLKQLVSGKHRIPKCLNLVAISLYCWSKHLVLIDLLVNVLWRYV